MRAHAAPTAAGKRAREMLRRLREQISELKPALTTRPDVIILYDRNGVEDGLLDKVVSESTSSGDWPATARVLPTA